MNNKKYKFEGLGGSIDDEFDLEDLDVDGEEHAKMLEYAKEHGDEIMDEIERSHPEYLVKDPLYESIMNRYDKIILVNTNDEEYVRKKLEKIVKLIYNSFNVRYEVINVDIKNGSELLEVIKPFSAGYHKLFFISFNYDIDGKDLIKWYNSVRDPFPHPDKLVLVGTQYEVNSDLKPYITVMNNYLPTKQEIEIIVNDFINSYYTYKHLKQEVPPNTGDYLLGLSPLEIERAIMNSIKQFGSIKLDYLSAYRKILLESDGILELYQPEDVDTAIGLENIISLIKQCVNSKEGKGTLLLGVPGSGKSLIAKNLAKEHTVIKFNIERIFSKYVGDSEKNIIDALGKVERFAKTGPVIVFIDEVEKILSGINSSGDSGVTARVLKVLLEWLQDKGENIYLLATANRIDEIVYTNPEYFRAERWDFIFGLGFPSTDVLYNIMQYYCKKYGVKEDISVIEERMTPAEIASICRLSKITKRPLSECKNYVKLTKEFMGGNIDNYIETLKKYAVMVDELYADDNKSNNSSSPKYVENGCLL